MKTTSVLFLCTGNSARSQMAEAYARHLGQGRVLAFSAGLEPTGLNPLAVRVMAEDGLDISGQTSTDLRSFMGRATFDLAVFVCSGAEARCPSIYPFALNKLSAPFDDPTEAKGTEGERLAVFRRVRGEIKAWVAAWIAGLAA